ncbi:helix-turn-helix domain-containing protein [Phaeovulum vinaykumarii]|uniref:Protein RodZ, contains Xre-like HTH and DUF4115 domains n=1 Tax=Phaeovulum vinaykumarii TaxID=407234 RepID=A0A1N7M0Z3_9RHOB|nr:helix-turn-helix domain-containing protein [Phaeovulum vinaykumarii]SIS79722.1 protein RodZ, contains Xre-like HTH and DUF4115 domains [Phaeovulum vinaykumarii]SOC09624.1 cytoskeletal protein RodZ [Phaeovulum vinaykumarii]
MIGRWSKPKQQELPEPRGFDDFDLRLGDVMRGERATLAKSLLDVQRELRIKASYIAAIENADLDAFETPSFVSGFVRSYARYLGLDPDWAFERFCRETGFQPVHGMAAAASGPKQRREALPTGPALDPLADPNAAFVPRSEPFWAGIEPRAVGSVMVLALMVTGLGYGGWTVLQEVQRVELAPVDQAPGVVAMLDPIETLPASAELDPIAGAAQDRTLSAAAPGGFGGGLGAPETVDRLYRPQALETPVLVARDGPIAAIDPEEAGVLAAADVRPAAVAAPVLSGSLSPDRTLLAEALGTADAGANPAAGTVRTVAEDAPEVAVIAVRPSWVRIQAADGTVLFEKVMDAGEHWVVPKLEEPPVMRTGESGAIYFALSGETFGPAGARGQVSKNIVLAPEALGQRYAEADLGSDADLARAVAVADASLGLSRP